MLEEKRFQMSISNCRRDLTRVFEILVQHADQDINIECPRIATALAAWQ
jgi:hypothetical protein